MGVVTPQQSNPNDTIEADDINTPVNQLAAVINGGIDSTNIADNAVTTAKLASKSVSDSQLDYPRWGKEIGRRTLETVGDTITITGIPVMKYLYIITNLIPSGAIRGTLRFNNDSGANYAVRASVNGAADVTAVSQTSIAVENTTATIRSTRYEIVNVATQEKTVGHRTSDIGTAGAGNTPSRTEGSSKWANTADAITRVDVINDQAGDFAVGSEVIVLGHD